MTIKVLFFLLNLVLIVMALRGSRRAYIALLLLAAGYFPVSVGFTFKPGVVDSEISLNLFWVSLQNYRHIVLFAVFYIMTCIQLGDLNVGEFNWKKMLLAGFITLLMGVYVEFAQWYTGNGHCRVRDLIPDLAGIMVGFFIQVARHKAFKMPPK